MPERCPVAGSQRHRISGYVARESYSGFGCEDTTAGSARDERVTPTYFSGLIVDGSQERFSSNGVIRAGPAIFAMFGLEEINSVAILSADDERFRGGIIAGRTIVRRAALVWSHETPIARRFL